MRSRINVDKAKIPYRFQIILGGKSFGMEWHYNSNSKQFSCTLYDAEDRVLICNEPLIYGNKMFSFIPGGTEFPAVALVPIDESGQESAVTWENFGKTVFLTLEDELSQV